MFHWLYSNIGPLNGKWAQRNRENYHLPSEKQRLFGSEKLSAVKVFRQPKNFSRVNYKLPEIIEGPLGQGAWEFNNAAGRLTKTKMFLQKNYVGWEISANLRKVFVLVLCQALPNNCTDTFLGLGDIGLWRNISRRCNKTCKVTENFFTKTQPQKPKCFGKLTNEEFSVDASIGKKSGLFSQQWARKKEKYHVLSEKTVFLIFFRPLFSSQTIFGSWNFWVLSTTTSTLGDDSKEAKIHWTNEKPVQGCQNSRTQFADYQFWTCFCKRSTTLAGNFRPIFLAKSLSLSCAQVYEKICTDTPPRLGDIGV